MIELFPHIGQLVCKSGFCLLTPPVKVELDLTQGFQPSNQIVVEDAEIREWFRLCLTSFLLSE